LEHLTCQNLKNFYKMEDIIKVLTNTKVALTMEDLRQINNLLVDISLSTEKIVTEKNRIQFQIEEIKNILDSHAEIN
jgi:hypothetical protein